MKKYFSLVLMIVFLVFAVKTVNADDGGPNSDFWIIDRKINCLSIINPDAMGDNTFLVFDYSAKVGQTRGKPWTIVEKGKCYEIDDGSEGLYLIKIIKGNEREVFSNYSSYSPTDSLPQIFCKNTHEYTNNQYRDFDCNTTKFEYSITPEYVNFFGEKSVTTSSSESIHFTGITANALFPTKYDFGYPVTSYSAHIEDELKPIINYSSFISASNLYSSLAKQLVSTLQSCDNRLRVEHQYKYDTTPYGKSLSLHVENVVWRLSNNKDVVVQTFDSNTRENGLPKGLTTLDILNGIKLMGCTDNFSSFLQEHQKDFNTIDLLAQEVITKYPSALKKNSDDYLSPINQRNSTEISKILEFSKIITSTSNITLVPSIQKTIVSTTLDEPTLEKKNDMILNSPNPFMRIYVWLPLVALLGIIGFLIFKKNKCIPKK